MSTPSDPGAHSPATTGPLADATQALRGRSERRAVEIADDVLQRARRAARRALPVRAHPPYEYVRISDQVIVARLRERLDDALVDAAVGRAYLAVDRDQHVHELTIELYARYGTVLLDVADHARLLAALVLVDQLGDPSTPVPVVVSHVHISDVTVGDPHLTDPSEGLG